MLLPANNSIRSVNRSITECLIQDTPEAFPILENASGGQHFLPLFFLKFPVLAGHPGPDFCDYIFQLLKTKQVEYGNVARR